MRIAVHLVGCVALTLSLGACSIMDTPTWVNQNRVEVRDDQFTDTLVTSDIDDGTFHAISVYHYRYGNGPLTAAVSYDPRSSSNTKGKAEASARRIRDGLIAKGVKDVRVTTTASPGSGAVSTTIISFPAIVAEAPTGCTMMPGYDTPASAPSNAGVENPDYRYGCTIETLISRQVSRPSDLLGKPGFNSNADGRRQADVVEQRGYYSEKMNPPLKGEKSSGK